MADLADVLDAMQMLAVAAVYPEGGAYDSGQGFHTGLAHQSIANGIPTASGGFAGGMINIGQGWPPAGAVDAAMKAGNSLVSIYAVPSSTSKQPVPLDTGSVSVMVVPIHGLTASQTDTGFRLVGTPGPQEYCTAIVNHRAVSVVAASGDTAQSIAAVLANAIVGQRPGTSWVVTGDGASVVIPGLTSLTVRIGAPGAIGRTIDRQRRNVMLGVWSPTPSDRTVIGRAVEMMVAQNLTVTMPDTSRSIWIGQGVNVIDKYENELAFRRDLTVQCQWDTVESFPGYEVTAVDVSLGTQDGTSTTDRVY